MCWCVFFFFFCTGTDHLKKIISLTLCSSREYFSSILQQYSRGKRRIVTKLISVRIIQSWKRERKNFRLRWQCLFPLSQNSKNNFLIQYPYNHYFSRTINKISLITWPQFFKTNPFTIRKLELITFISNLKPGYNRIKNIFQQKDEKYRLGRIISNQQLQSIARVWTE